MNDAPSRFEAAALRWVALLNSFGHPDAARAAMADNVCVERFGFGPNQGRLVERIQGADHVRRWVAMSPPEVRFELAGAIDVDVTAEAPTAHVRYRVSAPMFENFGRWGFRLAADDRVVWLSHAPEDVDDAHLEGRHDAAWRDLLIGPEGEPLDRADLVTPRI